MMTHVYRLTDAEKRLIDSHRESIKFAERQKEKQQHCKHPNWRYIGHSHNDDAYECSTCFKIKYE